MWVSGSFAVLRGEVYPLDKWGWRDIWAYIVSRELPYPKLYDVYGPLLGWDKARFVNFFSKRFENLGSPYLDGFFFPQFRNSIGKPGSVSLTGTNYLYKYLGNCLGNIYIGDCYYLYLRKNKMSQKDWNEMDAVTQEWYKQYVADATENKYEKIAMMQMIEKWEANEERTAQKQYGDVYAEVRLGERIW